MILKRIEIIGFRNFNEATINLNEKSLIIGANDVGKSNLLYAIRLLLDRSFSEIDIEPKDHDFYAYEQTDKINIRLYFEGIEEDCLLAKLRHYVSDEGKMCLEYVGERDSETGSKSYEISAGKDDESLENINGRFYTKFLNVKYVSSNRDLFAYIKREKRNLLHDAKSERTDKEKESDTSLIDGIDTKLTKINENIESISYIKKSTSSINDELENLSHKNASQEVVFYAGNTDVTSFLDSVKLGSKSKGKNIVLGGDGRNNQIFLSLWAARNDLQIENPTEVSIYCIEEPEAHLHPHQQRKLAEYLSNTLQGQVIITSHSPQIAAEFDSESLIRLQTTEDCTTAASDGCSEDIDDAMLEFGHRLNIISAEAFFSDVVFLVEGMSEVIFYKALAKQNDVDLDKYNISILSVEGVGFKAYIELLEVLSIPWVLRTDNDIFKIPKKEEYRFAGVGRCLSILGRFYNVEQADQGSIIKHKDNLKGFDIVGDYEENLESANAIREILINYDLYTAENDLENDLLSSGLRDAILEHFEVDSEDDAIEILKQKKATHLNSFLKSNFDSLQNFDQDSTLFKPLKRCIDIAKAEE
jgi:putative ATP-dependent endonuclease of OLD family